MSTYVFFIGGTGARVLRSLTMLLASGVKTKSPIVPIVIDYDVQNGDLVRSKDLLAKYNAIRDYGKYISGDEGFFSSEVVLKDYSLADIKGENGRDTFAKYIDYETLRLVSPTTADLVMSLYDNSPSDNPRTEMNLQMSVGFKGNPNLGSVVFNEYFQNKAYGYESFKADFGSNDRVFIVGSIFGGTGSSGLPTLVKKFRQDGTISSQGNTQYLRNAPLGACVVLPYFKVKPKEESAINSQTFNSKAKAALAYYDKEIKKYMNELYYIGCDAMSDAYENIEGGKDQSNNAHLIELLSAISVIQFANRNDAEMNNRDANNDLIPNFYEYTTMTGLADGNRLPSPAFQNILDVPNTKEGSLYTQIVKHLNSFAFFCKYCQDFTFTGEDAGGFLKGAQTYYSTLKQYFDKNVTDFGGKLNSFQQDFMAWVKELDTNPLLPVKLFDFTKDLEHLLTLSGSEFRIKGIEGDMKNALKQGINAKREEANVKPESVFLAIGKEAGDVAAEKLIN